MRRHERSKPISIELSLIIALIAHFVGDYILQTNHMALQKTSHWGPALLHGFTYTVPFLFATQSLPALLIIALTHAVIDRYRLAKYLVWFKNQFAPKAFRSDRESMKTTGYSAETPIWLSTWLLFIADNTVHVIINTLAIIFLGHIGVMW